MCVLLAVVCGPVIFVVTNIGFPENSPMPHSHSNWSVGRLLKKKFNCSTVDSRAPRN